MNTEQMLTEKQGREFAEFCELLPWYVNRTLNEAEMHAMEEHLRHCEACAGELPILRAVGESMHSDSVAVLAPRPDIERFFANASRDKAALPLRAMAWVGAAVAATLAILAVVLNWTQTEVFVATPEVFETATGADSGATFDYVLQISFNEEVDSESRSAAVEALVPVSVAGPDSAGNYRVVIRLPARSMRELQDFTQSIESDAAISNAAIVAVELPVESR
jgi:hypothetical protein